MVISPPPQEHTASTNASPTRNHQIGRLVGNGSFGLVWQIAEDRVRKDPKIYAEHNNERAYSNMVNRAEIQTEKAVYERLGSHAGIIECFKATDESIELAFANQGDLAAYMQANLAPAQELRAKWIRLLVDTFAHVHARKIIIQDIALRNVLLHDNTLKLCDFGECILLPLDTDMGQFHVNGTTPQIEILHLGCMLYSIAVWREFKYDYFDLERWPEAGELPMTEFSLQVLFKSVGMENMRVWKHFKGMCIQCSW
ncbi:kinase-like domain-containing protein [Lineolata rhizophorae]|uniref:Kinase-like domain-containing protein n=1 Tax=Lineolata rhizophorae TaxID=578093 RepID=A0A6A6P9C0_9PEZI|nr:kinase-like domain-containing protein [Lineolata rhizophorae]